VESRKRKVRSDKKRDVKPTIPISLYECISRISYVTNTPIKDVGEIICENGLYSKKVFDYLSTKFRRNYRFNNTVYIGNLYQENERRVKYSGIKKRITMRFSQKIYEQIADLAYSLDVTISSATAILLDASIKNTDIINEYVYQYIDEQLDPNRKKQLKMVFEFIRKENPYEEDISISELISYLFDEFMDGTRNLKKVLETWLDKVIEKDEP